MDPLSIASGAAALAQLCIKQAIHLYQGCVHYFESNTCIKLSVKVTCFVSDARTIDDNVHGLNQGLSALSEVLISVSLAWTSNPEITAAQYGADRALWVSVKGSITRCSTVLDKFQQLLNRVSPEDSPARNLFKRSIAKIKLDLNQGDVDGFRAEVDIYCRVLSIALNSITTCAIIRRDRTNRAVFQRLGTIEESIETLAQHLNKGGSSSPPALTPDTTQSLSSFLKAAKIFRSTASEYSSSSGSTVVRSNATERSSSVFGEPLSTERTNHIEGWIPAPLNEILEGPIADVASSTRWNGAPHEVETLPQLMSVLENVAQMADRFQAVEKQKNFTKDEQIRALQEKCSILEQDLEKCWRKSHSSLEKEKQLTLQLKEMEDDTRRLLQDSQSVYSGLEKSNRILNVKIKNDETRYHQLRNNYDASILENREFKKMVDSLLGVKKYFEDFTPKLEAKLENERTQRVAAEIKINALGRLLRQKSTKDVAKQVTDFAAKFPSLSTSKPAAQKALEPDLTAKEVPPYQPILMDRRHWVSLVSPAQVSARTAEFESYSSKGLDAATTSDVQPSCPLSSFANAKRLVAETQHQSQSGAKIISQNSEVTDRGR